MIGVSKYGLSIRGNYKDNEKEQKSESANGFECSKKLYDIEEAIEK